MLTDVQLINGGLSKIASNRISRIDPAATPLEKFMAVNYPQWKRSELTKRRWVFAKEEEYKLTYSAVLTDTKRPYKYPLPIDCLRPLRSSLTEWVQRGRFVYSAYPNLQLDYIRNAPESDFDPLFNDVLEGRIAYESVEYVTQSTSKKQTALDDYKEAVRVAGQANAFTIGEEDIDEDDSKFSWVGDRY